MTLSEKIKNSRFLIPVVLLIILVIGSMYAGIATATEAAAFGVIGACCWPGRSAPYRGARSPQV